MTYSSCGRAMLAAATTVAVLACGWSTLAETNPAHMTLKPGNIPRSELAKNIDQLDKVEAQLLVNKACMPHQPNTADCLTLIKAVCANIVTLIELAKEKPNGQEQCDAHRWCHPNVYTKIPLTATCSPPIKYAK